MKLSSKDYRFTFFVFGMTLFGLAATAVLLIMVNLLLCRNFDHIRKPIMMRIVDYAMVSADSCAPRDLPVNLALLALGGLVGTLAGVKLDRLQRAYENEQVFEAAASGFELPSIELQTSENYASLHALLLKLATDKLQLGAIIARADGSVYYSNELARKISPTLKTLDKVWDISSSSEMDFQQIWETTRKEGHYSFKITVGSRQFEVNSSYLPIDDGFISFFLSDRTTVFDKEKTLLQALMTEQEANQKRLALLNDINYELRKPLTGILGFADLLRDDSLPGEERREYLDFIIQSGNHLLQLWTSVLELTTLECGMLEVEHEKLNLNSIVTDALNSARSTLPPEIRLSSQKTVRDIDAMIEGDGSIIGRIFEKLLENAGQRVANGGWIEIGYTVAADSVTFCVTDSGEAIPEEKMARIFEPFKNGMLGDGDTVELGLAIAKLMIELLSGTIAVKNNPVGGINFSFTLPLHAHPAAAAVIHAHEA